MDNNSIKFAKRFDDILYEKQISAAEISRRTGISEATMSKYRKGIHMPQGQNLQIIANALGVTTDYLLGSDGAKNLNETQDVNSAPQVNLSSQEISDFSRRFSNLLYRKRVKASDLAKTTGIAEATISQYKKGVYFPSSQNLQLIAKALGVTIDYLLGIDMTDVDDDLIYQNMVDAAQALIPGCKLEPVSPPAIDYELNIIEKLPCLTDEAKQLISVTVDALVDGNQNHFRVLKAYYDALNRLCPSNAK